PAVIQPASAVVYVGGAAVLLIWPLLLSWKGVRFWRFMGMISLGSVIGFVVFIAWPLNIVRPPFLGSRFGEPLMRFIFSIDRTANCFPSFHAYFAVLGALIISEQIDSRKWMAVAWLIALTVVISTITTGQH